MERLGYVNDNELSEIVILQQRKNALVELYQAKLSDETRNNVVNDLAVTQQKISDWWVTLARNHNWTYTDHNSWYINFETKEIFLT